MSKIVGIDLGKVLRPAQVVVGRSNDNHPEEQNSDEGLPKEGIN